MYKIKLQINDTVQTIKADDVDKDQSGNLIVTESDDDGVTVYNQHVWISYTHN